MGKRIALALLLAVASLAGVQNVEAAEPTKAVKAPQASATPQVLQGLTGAKVQKLTKQEAHKIRGQRIWFLVDGLSYTPGFTGTIKANGDVRYLKLWADPATIHVEIIE